MPYYSFILVCYNNWSITEQALETLISSFDPFYKSQKIELIIVDNGSQDETHQGIREFAVKNSTEYFNIIICHLTKNMGYPVGLNHGIAISRGEIITILNNDLIFPPNWFNGIDRTLVEDNSVGIAVPYLSYASGPQDVNIRLNSYQEIKNFSEKFIQENKNDFKYLQRVISACLTFKRVVLQKIGLYDYWFGLGLYDDDDWSLRAAIAGYKLVLTGSSFVYHVGNHTFKDQSDFVSAAITANQKKFLRKWNLKNSENKEGIFHTRREVITAISYDKNKHFFPVSLGDYQENTPEFSKHKKKNTVLLIADWTNAKSEWQNRLKAFLNMQKLHNNISLWVPQEYFLETEVTCKIQELLNKDTPIEIITNNISPQKQANFLRYFDGILAIDNDYVNRYFIDLATKLQVNII